MAIFVTLINFTEQDVATIKDSPSRLDAARQALKELGGEMKDFYLTMGGYDAVAIVEVPSDEVAARFALMMGSRGNVRTTTLRAFGDAEFRQIVGALP